MPKKIKLLLVIITVFTLLLTACTAEKKPLPKTETIVVPEVSDLSFDIIKLNGAPDVIKKQVKTMQDAKDQEFITYSSANGKGYIIIFPEALQQNVTVTVDKIEQRILDENYTWLNVKLSYEETEAGDAKTDKPLIAKFSLKREPKAVGFQLSHVNAKPTAQPNNTTAQNKTAQLPNQPQNEPQKPQGPAIRITNPMPGDAVRNPVEVSGVVAALDAELRIRIRNSAGEVIAEKPVKLTDNNFATVINFAPPQQQEQGFVEAVLINPQDQSENGRASVAVYLQPGHANVNKEDPEALQP